MRERILDQGERIDGRKTTDIRPIACEVRALPRAHGVALFTRGETQALVYATLGSDGDEQTIDALHERTEKHFLLHYNFPPFSVGEVRPLRGPARREVGHGNLAERALASRCCRASTTFPYTMRVVSEMLESNGSSSMATVCGGDARADGRGRADRGAGRGHRDGPDRETATAARDPLRHPRRRGPPRRHGLQGRRHQRRASPRCRWTSRSQRRLERDGARRSSRRATAGCTSSTAMERDSRSAAAGLRAAPELVGATRRAWRSIRIKPDRIRDMIGPGGSVIRGIQETTGAKIDVEDSGRVSDLRARRRRARPRASDGPGAHAGGGDRQLYLGKVKRITDFGAFVEIFPGTDGLIHISHLAEGRVENGRPTSWPRATRCS